MARAIAMVAGAAAIGAFGTSTFAPGGVAVCGNDDGGTLQDALRTEPDLTFRAAQPPNSP